MRHSQQLDAYNAAIKGDCRQGGSGALTLLGYGDRLNNFSDIVAFVRVVEAHSFVAAAQTLGMSPSAISKAVSRLEERLGARLLNRTTRSLSLTDLGTSFYDRCREALSQLDQAESEVSESRGVPRGRLRVDVPVSLGRLLIVPALPRFIAAAPRTDRADEHERPGRRPGAGRHRHGAARRRPERFEPDRAPRRQLSRRDLRLAGIHRARRRAAHAGRSEARALHRDVPARHEPDPRMGVSQERRRAHVAAARCAVVQRSGIGSDCGSQRRRFRALARLHRRSADRLRTCCNRCCRTGTTSRIGRCPSSIRSIGKPTAKIKAFIDFVAGLFPQAAALPAATQSSTYARRVET